MVLFMVLATVVVVVVVRSVASPDSTPRANSGKSTTAGPIPASTGTSTGPDFSLPPNYGSHTLFTGFLPDPWSLDVTSGGTLPSSSVGCTGWVTAAPDVELRLSGSSAFLRIFVTASDDTTLAINDPAGRWHCSDDTYGSNPAIDFADPAEGTYDIWVGSYLLRDYIPSTLYATELASVDPTTVAG